MHEREKKETDKTERKITHTHTFRERERLKEA